MGVFSAEGCCEAGSGSDLHYFATRTSSLLLVTDTGILSTVITVPDDIAYAVIVRAKATIAISAGGVSSFSVAITDSVHGAIGGDGGDAAASTSVFVQTSAARDPVDAGQHTVIFSGSDTGGAGTATVTKAELEIELVPADSTTVAAAV